MGKGGDGWSSLDLPIFLWYSFRFTFMVFQYFLSALKGMTLCLACLEHAYYYFPLCPKLHSSLLL